MPIRYKNLTLAVLMSKRHQMLKQDLRAIKLNWNNQIIQVLDKKSIVLYKNPKGDIIVYNY